MPLVQKRRRTQVEDDDDPETSTPAQPRRRQQNHTADTPRSTTPANDALSDYEGDGADSANGNTDQLVKKVIRFALACEYARQPIRRADIASKVLGSHSRQFRAVFEEAQTQLRAIFGMEMVELPLKDKVTIQQRRAAQRSEKAATNSHSYILTSVLPAKFKDPSILRPARVPTAEVESAYIGLYTFVVAVIYLSGGQLPEAKLDRYLRRMNADQSTPIDKTDKVLQRMVKEGYIVRIRDSSSGEELVDYMVGPRGKTEVGPEGIAGLVRSVYGDAATEDLESRIERSLSMFDKRDAPATQANGTNGASSGTRPRGRPRRQAEEQTQAMEEDDDDE